MSNVQAPYGFRHVGSLAGASANFEQVAFPISSSYATAIGIGDCVVFSSGKLQLAAAGTTQIAGVFVGCKYQSISLKQPRFGYWPGNGDASADAEGYIINSPYATFQVQSSGSAITQANVDKNANFVAGTVNTTTGFSAQALDQTTVGTTATLPFRIVKIGLVGSDDTSSFNQVIVVFNNQMLRGTTGL